MEAKLIHEQDGQRTFVIVLDTGEEVMNSLSAFAEKEHISAAQISAIGALSEVELNYFDWESKKYKKIPVKERVEVASLLGDIALSPEDRPSLHVHIVVGKSDGSALAGHLGNARVRPTLEIVLTESPTHLRKVYDPVSRLALIRPKAG
jgi:predicted DNA-binding protein with PD1-like motif